MSCSLVVTAGSAGGSPGGSLEFRLMVTEQLEVPDVEVAHYEDNSMRSTITLSNKEPLPPSITSLSAKGSLKVRLPRSCLPFMRCTCPACVCVCV